jgi:hypothetical protein
MKSMPPAPTSARRLLERGWRQGALLSARGTEHAWARRRVEGPEALECWEWEKHASASEEWWVLVSQDCDLVAAADKEPRVEFLRAFWTADKGVIRQARLNSARRYLLATRHTRAEGGEEGLVVDATVRLLVEKDSLLDSSPAEQGVALDREARRRLGEWLGRRYARPAIPDALVKAIQKPLVDALRKLKEDDPLWEYLEHLDEVRFSVLEESPPYGVSLVCILAPGSELGPLEQAELQGLFEDVLDGRRELTRLDAVEFRSAESISLADYLARQPLPLSEFSLEE